MYLQFITATSLRQNGLFFEGLSYAHIGKFRNKLVEIQFDLVDAALTFAESAKTPGSWITE